jgi:hypothetical protein
MHSGWLETRPTLLAALAALAACGKGHGGSVMPEGIDLSDDSGNPPSDATPLDGTSMDAQAPDSLAGQSASSDGANDDATDESEGRTNRGANDAGVADHASSDATLDAAAKACGVSTCHAGQACVLVVGGPAPRCVSPVDGGCPEGLVLVAACVVPTSQTTVTPGCSDPPPAGACVNLPDGCADPCACYCTRRGGTCMVMPEFLWCGLP